MRAPQPVLFCNRCGASCMGDRLAPHLALSRGGLYREGVAEGPWEAWDVVPVIDLEVRR